MSIPLVAIVGRPNVGKSTLFNKIVGKRISIVDDTPGVTRDRLYYKANWLNYEFMLVDTGGIDVNKDDVMISNIKYQAQIAINNADVIIFVCDINTGITPIDLEVCGILRKSRKPVILCLNKEDNIGKTSNNLYEFYNLGIGEPYVTSAVHGHGTGDLLDKVVEYFDDIIEDDEDDDRIKVSFIGKPNVGKSSLVNKILHENRMIVSDVAGTTRDSVDSYFENNIGKFTLIDTAGMRKRKKVNDSIEKYSVLRSLMAIDRSDVVVMMIDATQGFTEQDSKIVGYAHDQGKACIIAVNKWDLINKNDKTMSVEEKKIKQSFAFMSYAPIIFISAQTGQRIDKLFELIVSVNEQSCMRISTGTLNDVLSDATLRVQPPTDKGKRLKIYYITQASVKPPTFVIFCNDKKLFHFSYLRYIENQIRSNFGLIGTPVSFVIRERQ